MNRTGDYSTLARLAREKREKAAAHDELHTVLKYCRAAKGRMDISPLPLTGSRAKIWAHLVDAIDLVEQELARSEA